jgi:eukaryotic-like serine/threonine-protein kinase
MGRTRQTEPAAAGDVARGMEGAGQQPEPGTAGDVMPGMEGAGQQPEPGTAGDVVRATEPTGTAERARWARIQELFHVVVDLPLPERRAALQARTEDDSVVAEVLELAAADARGGSPLEAGVAGLADQLLAANTIASQIGPYRIVRPLGEGGMGVVYLAERTDLGSLVAIKLLRDAGLSPARLERFASEQRMLAQLEHPTIARLYHAGALPDGTPFFVMEYVEGEPLTEHCRQRSASIAERLGLFRALCEAVQFAHGHAIIHRDIKPSNVLVKPDGSVRLLDFGIAKHLEPGSPAADQTRTGLRVMTPAYAAPEQRRGDPVGIYTDVYSLGVVLYELLAGRLPFDRSAAPGVSTQAERDRVLDKPSAAARGSEAGVTASRAAWADLDVLVLAAMHPEPQRRYRSVDAVIRDVDHYLRREPLEARPDSAGYRLRRFVTRNWRSVSLAAMSLAVVVGLVGSFTARLATARDAAVAQLHRTQRIQKFTTDLLTGGDGEDLGPGKELRVVTLVDRGAREARALHQDPELQADLFHTLGSLYLPLGELDSADSLLQLALARRTALHGEWHAATAETLGVLGALRSLQGQYAEAEQLLRRSLEVGRQLLPASDERVVQATQGLGGVLTLRGRFADALPILSGLMELERVPGALSPSDLATSTTLLAHTHFYLGHYAEADQRYRRALELDRARLGDQHATVADDLSSLGSVQFERGNYREAEQRFREAMAIREQFYGRDNPQTADALGLIGRVLIQQDRLAEAAAALAEVLPVFENAYGKVHLKVAVVLDELGQLARKQGRLDDAEGLHRREEDILHAVLGDNHYRIANARGRLGEVYVEREDYLAAERWFRESLAMYRETLPPEHPRTATAEARLGRALLHQRRFADAALHSLAGYAVLARVTTPAQEWHRAVRSDLAAIYEALGQPAQAARLRAP